jgi:hypothetical protein
MTNTSQYMPRSRRQAIAVESLRPLAVPPKAAAQMLGYGLTRTYALLKAGELQSYVDGGARRVLVKSISDFIERKLKADSKPVRRGPGRPRKTATT